MIEESISAATIFGRKKWEMSGTLIGAEAKLPLSDSLSIEGSYRFSLSASHKMNGEDVLKVLEEAFYTENPDGDFNGGEIGITNLSFKVKYALTENISLAAGYKKQTVKTEIKYTAFDSFYGDLSIKEKLEESFDGITLGVSILF